MHENAFSFRLVLAELPNGLEEGQPLDVTHRSADFAQHEIDFILAKGNEFLDLVSDMRDHLNRLAEIVAASFLFENVRVDPTRRDRIRRPCRHVREPLVMSKVEVSLGPVIGDINLTMLEWRHRAGIDIEIGIELSQPDGVTACLEQGTQGRRGQSFAERGHHTACDEHESRHIFQRPPLSGPIENQIGSESRLGTGVID